MAETIPAPQKNSKAEGPSTACDLNLKLGDPCDACWRGIMLPPGGLDYYQKLMKDPNPLPPHGHEKIICPRCGHFHRFLASKVETGYDETKS
jgi:hypothetical protein